MADVKFSALPTGTPTKDDTVAGVQTGTTKTFTIGNILALAYPVGSIYIAVVSTNPATLLGFGTWSAFGTGRTLVGIDTGDTDFDVVEETGGAKTVTLTSAEMPSHTHVQDAHTHVQDAHAHNQQRHGTTTGGLTGITTAPDTSSSNPTSMGPNTASTTTTNQNATATNQNTGGGGAHNNLAPFIVCYFWKRRF